MENGVEITDEKEVANTLNNYFVEKINKLKKDIDTRNPLTPLKEKMKKKKHSYPIFNLI